MHPLYKMYTRAYQIFIVNIESESEWSGVEHLTGHEQVDKGCFGGGIDILSIILSSELEQEKIVQHNKPTVNNGYF